MPKVSVLHVTPLTELYANYRQFVWQRDGHTMTLDDFAVKVCADTPGAFTEAIDGTPICDRGDGEKRAIAGSREGQLLKLSLATATSRNPKRSSSTASSLSNRNW
jgi:hypothetical protein